MGELIFRSRSKSLAHISINGLMRIESCWLTARAAVARRGTRAATVASHCDYCLVDEVWSTEKSVEFVLKTCLWDEDEEKKRESDRIMQGLIYSACGMRPLCVDLKRPLLVEWGVLTWDYTLVGDLSWLCGGDVSDFGGSLIWPSFLASAWWSTMVRDLMTGYRGIGNLECSLHFYSL